MPPQQPTDFPLSFLIGLPIMWALVSGIISFVGGWAALAGRYRTELPPPPNLRRFRSGSFAFLTNYNNVLSIGHSDTGLYLGIFVLFRLFHPPLLIPWHDIRSRRRGGWVLKYDTLTIDAGREVRLRLRTSVTAPFEKRLPPITP